MVMDVIEKYTEGKLENTLEDADLETVLVKVVGSK